MMKSLKSIKSNKLLVLVLVLTLSVIAYNCTENTEGFGSNKRALDWIIKHRKLSPKDRKVLYDLVENPSFSNGITYEGSKHYNYIKGKM